LNNFKRKVEEKEKQNNILLAKVDEYEEIMKFSSSETQKKEKVINDKNQEISHLKG
jgi:hypothetical protein